MTVTEWAGSFTAAGSFGALLTAWWLAVRPWLQRRRDNDAMDRQYRRETHEALYGIPEKRDDSGAVIHEAEAGLIAQMKALQSRPILNGGGKKVIDTVERLDRWSVEHSHLHDAMGRIPKQRKPGEGS